MPALTKICRCWRYGPVTVPVPEEHHHRLWRGVQLPAALIFWDHAKMRTANEGRACFARETRWDINRNPSLLAGWLLVSPYHPDPGVYFARSQPDGGAGSGRDGGCGRLLPRR